MTINNEQPNAKGRVDLCYVTVMFLPWTAPDCLSTGYDYGPDRIISHGLTISGVISHV